MARIPRSAVGDMVYHVLNRANGREKIFQNEKDYALFETILFEAKEKYPMRILSPTRILSATTRNTNQLDMAISIKER